MKRIAKGSIADIGGLAVGHFTDSRRPTGCTVVLCGRDGAAAGVDVRGGAPGTRETDLLSPLNVVDRVHAVLLAGGSAFGLDAASGVMRWLDERGIGVAVGTAGAGPLPSRLTPPRGAASEASVGARIARVPIVPAAILFDLYAGDLSIRPDADAGYAACEAAASGAPLEQGSIGAGAGALVGKLFGLDRAMKGGIGSASLASGAHKVAAIVAVNATGDVLDPESGAVLAGARGDDGKPLRTTRALLQGRAIERSLQLGSATTIGIVATDAALSKAEASRLARLAHHGLARAIDPLTPFDGDTLFALATGTAGQPHDMAVLGVFAARAVSLAIGNAVLRARGFAPWPSAAES